MAYLRKRHPLYFINDKLCEKQVTDLIGRLIYRIKQKEELEGSTRKKNTRQKAASKENVIIKDWKQEDLADRAKAMLDGLDDDDDEIESDSNAGPK